jgi:CRISPR/Cas system Type II protein with McrA/HNH and RuvC-like nuclease domain
MTAFSVCDAVLEAERSKARKLEIIFGQWWRYYAVPNEFRLTLYAERQHCPYCGAFLESPAETTETAFGDIHLDHMDPLSLGGEESIRNTVYVCAACNMSKGRRSFVDWLNKLTPEYRAVATAIYIEKHGHPPEAFVRKTKSDRLTLPRIELQYPEDVLRRLFPKPIVDGPPN